MKLIALLKRPAHSDVSPKYWIKMAFLFGSFVFLFLYLFKPFQISEIDGSNLIVCISFGGITTLSMLILDLVFLPLILRRVTEEKWNVGLSILWTLMHVLTISVFNGLYFTYTFLGEFKLSGVLWFIIPTSLVSIFPITIILILQERAASKRIELESSQIIDSIKHSARKKDSREIKIRSKNVNEDLNIELSQLLFLRSADNYVTVYYLDSEVGLTKSTLRNTLATLAEDLKSFDQIFHCHRSHIVNLDQVSSVSGNAQGFKLHFNDVNEVIPVSRKHNEFVKSYFVDGHKA